MVRTSIFGAALFLLGWSAPLFGVLRRGQRVELQFLLRRPHYFPGQQRLWGSATRS